MLDVARELTALYGTAEPPRPGVLHVMHVARDAQGRLAALRIGAPSTPKSETDFFVLNAARAHADAVLTSAENLRREPGLSHALQGPWAEALARYRRETLRKQAPLTCAILTRTGDLPFAHPVWDDGSTKIVFMPASAISSSLSLTLSQVRGEREGRGDPPPAPRIVQLPDLDAVSAAQWLRANGASLVSVEAGPRSVRSLYEASAISELWLTHWQSVSADAEFAGPLPADETLFRELVLLGSSERSEHGHSFRFERWSRSARARET
jgi:riboflavin biosynthesis pyrimidine reductase